MLEGLSITCFLASYAVALVLEGSRLFFKSGVRGALMLGFAAAGLLAHTLFLGYRAYQANSSPLSSAFDWYLCAAWILAALYLYLTLSFPRAVVGLFLLPLVIAFVLAARFFADASPFPRQKAALVWGTIHGVFLMVGTVAVAIGFVSGWMYLIQANRLKRKTPTTSSFQLPSLEWLAKTNARSIAASCLMLSLGLLSGVVLNAVMHAKGGDEVPWSDPIVWSSGVLLAWLGVTGLFMAIYKPARQGRKVAYLTLASFLFLACWLTTRWFVDSSHGPEKSRESQVQQDVESPVGEGRALERDAAIESSIARGEDSRR